MFQPWKLEYSGTTYDFGGPNLPVEVISWGQEADQYEVDDASAPRADGLYFGQDFVEPGVITVSVKIDFTDAPYPLEECVRRAMHARSELARVWRADTIRAKPGALAELTIGGEYIVEGRPRRAQFDDQFQNRGLIYAELQFLPAHHGAYLTGDSSGWQYATLNLVPAQLGGFRFPIRFPLRTAAEDSRSAAIHVAGDTATWPVIELQGPIQMGAQIEVVNRWRLYLNRALAWNQTARIDTRPGRVATYINDSPVQILDPRSSMLSDCSLLPGPNIAALRGVSIEGTAAVTFGWRDARGAI